MILTRSVVSSILSRTTTTTCGSRYGAAAVASSRRTVTTLQETLMAQVPEKQAEMAKLKKEHGSHV